MLLACSFCRAQSVILTDFKPLLSDQTALREKTSRTDVDGRACALLKIFTSESGWSFDAGLPGIMDTHYAEGEIWLYLPCSVRALTVSHRSYKPLVDWPVPVTLEPGRTYSVKLSVNKPTPVRKPEYKAQNVVQPPRPKPVQQVYTPINKDKLFCSHFIDAGAGLCIDRSCGFTEETFFGVQYTYLGQKVGPYVSAAFSTDESFSVFAGAAVRLLSPQESDLDWHVYGGLGLVYGNTLGFDVGTRFAWKSDASFSHWDFGFGCQFFGNTVMPSVNVGFYIWGIPVAVGLGLLCCCL